MWDLLAVARKERDVMRTLGELSAPAPVKLRQGLRNLVEQHGRSRYKGLLNYPLESSHCGRSGVYFAYLIRDMCI